MSGGLYLDALGALWNHFYVHRPSLLTPLALAPCLTSACGERQYVHDNGMLAKHNRDVILGAEAASWVEHQDASNLAPRRTRPRPCG